MKYAGISVETVRSATWMRADNATIGAWCRLQVYCAEQETGGTIAGAARFTRRDWLFAAGISQKDVGKVVAAGLAEWRGDDLFCLGYDRNGQAKVEASRCNGAKGGRSIKPAGSSEANPRVSETRNPFPIPSSPSPSLPCPAGQSDARARVEPPAPAPEPPAGAEGYDAGRRVSRAYAEAWEAQYKPATYRGGRGDYEALARLWDAGGQAAFDALLAVVPRYLADREPRVVKARHPLSWLCERLSQYEAPLPPPAKDADDATAAAIRRESEATNRRLAALVAAPTDPDSQLFDRLLREGKTSAEAAEAVEAARAKRARGRGDGEPTGIGAVVARVIGGAA